MDDCSVKEEKHLKMLDYNCKYWIMLLWLSSKPKYFFMNDQFILSYNKTIILK